MKDVLKQLQVLGCDVAGALSRFLSNEELYLSFVPLALQDEHVDKLRVAVQNCGAQSAHESAHALKGVWGNMGFTPLYNTVGKISDLTKNCFDEDVKSLFAQLETDLKKFQDAI